MAETAEDRLARQHLMACLSVRGADGTPGVVSNLSIHAALERMAEGGEPLKPVDAERVRAQLSALEAGGAAQPPIRAWAHLGGALHYLQLRRPLLDGDISHVPRERAIEISENVAETQPEALAMTAPGADDGASIMTTLSGFGLAAGEEAQGGDGFSTVIASGCKRGDGVGDLLRRIRDGRFRFDARDVMQRGHKQSVVRGAALQLAAMGPDAAAQPLFPEKVWADISEGRYPIAAPGAIAPRPSTSRRSDCDVTLCVKMASTDFRQSLVLAPAALKPLLLFGDREARDRWLSGPQAAADGWTRDRQRQVAECEARYGRCVAALEPSETQALPLGAHHGGMPAPRNLLYVFEGAVEPLGAKEGRAARRQRRRNGSPAP